jgi:hypothetical protein
VRAFASRFVSGTRRRRPLFGAVTSPFQSERDTDLPLGEIHIAPFQRNHLAAPQTRLTAEKHDEMRSRIDETRDFDDAFVFIEIVERPRLVRDPQKCDGAWHPFDNLPFHRLLQKHAQHCQDVVDGLRRFSLQTVFQALHIFVLDGIELLVAESGYEVNPKNHFLCSDSTRFLPVGSRMPLNKSRRELLQCGHLLLGFGATVQGQMPFTILSPTLGR